MVEKWRLPVIKELKNTFSVQFSSIVGTLYTFAIAVHAIVLALYIAATGVKMWSKRTIHPLGICQTVKQCSNAYTTVN